MIKIKKIVLIAIGIIMLGTNAFGLGFIPETDIKNNMEKTYGINVLTPKDVEYSEYINILEKSIKKFPDNIIKEITDYYLSKGIVTNVVSYRTEVAKDFYSESLTDDSTINIYIKTMESSLYTDSCYASEQEVIHKFSHFISDYIFKVYNLDTLKEEFIKLNEGYEYGVWNRDYSFEDEMAHIIWYAEANPSILRNISSRDSDVIHGKIKLLAAEFDKVFNSVSANSKLWLDALPQIPQDWAKDTIADMKEKSLIPEEFNGLYEAYISREDFYKLILNMLHMKFGENHLNNYFNITDYEEHLALDPVKGKIYVADGMNYTSYYEFLINSSNALNEAYQMGILSMDSINELEGHMSRLEVAKLLTYIANLLDVNISDYKTVNYIDIDKVLENEKPFIYITAGKGFIKGDGLSFKPFEYCTYQEAYIIINRLYNSL